MKRLAIFFSLAVCTLAGNAQTHHFLPNWKANDVYSYYFFKNKYTPKDSTFKQDRDTVVATFKVLTTSKKGSEIELKYNYSKSIAPQYPLQGIALIVSDVKRAHPIVLQLDSTGKYIGLKNWEFLKTKCMEAADQTKKYSKGEDVAEVDYWKKKLDTKEELERYFAEDIEFFFMLYGSQLKRKSTFDYADEMKNPYNAEFLPATTTLETKDDGAFIEVKLFTLPDVATGAQELAGIRQMIKQQVDNPELYTDATIFELQDYYVYLHNTGTGTHQTAIYLRYLKEGPKELIESWKFIAVK